MPNIFTRREQHFIVVFVLTVLAIIISGVDQETINRYELIWLIFYVIPMGLYIATDPERRMSGTK